MLDPAELRLHRSESDIVTYAQAEGYLQVAHDGSVLLLVEEAHEVDSLNASDLQERLSQAERELEEAGEDTERRRVAERDQRRFGTFLKLAGGG
jgi:F-type H+-transporting ATPase subunit epsilon